MIKARTNHLPLFILMGFILSVVAGCGISLRLPFQQKEVTHRQFAIPDSGNSKIKIYGEKEELEFAYAGGMRNVKMARPDKPRQTKRLTPKPHKPRKLTRKDSLFQAMLAKARRLQNAEKSVALAQKPKSPATVNSPQNNSVKTETMLTRKKSEPRRSTDSYEQLLQALIDSDKPVEVVIKRGKKYWIGTLVSRMFPFGSSGYEKALDWIVAHNQHFRNKKQLNMVRAGDRLLLPSRKLIEQIQFAQNGDGGN